MGFEARASSSQISTKALSKYLRFSWQLMTRFNTLTPHCFISGKNRGLKRQKIFSTGLYLSHAICRPSWLYRRHVSHSGKHPALIPPLLKALFSSVPLSMPFQMECSNAVHRPATHKSHHSHSCAVPLALGASFSHVPPTFSQISFLCTFRSFLSP